MRSYLKRAIVAFTVVLAVSACQSTNLPPEKLATIRSISVIGVAGNDWTWERQSIFNAQKQRLPGEDWRLGERAEKLTTSLLAQHYTIIPVGEFDRDALKVPVWQIGTKIGEQVSKFPVRPDAVLVVRKGGSIAGQPVANASASMIGYGVVSKTHLSQEYISIYAYIEFQLFDGKTFESLAEFTAVYPTSNLQDGSPFAFLKFPGKVNLLSTWTDTFQEQPPVNREIVRATLTNFIDRSIPYTLRKKSLIR